MEPNRPLTSPVSFSPHSTFPALHKSPAAPNHRQLENKTIHIQTQTHITPNQLPPISPPHTHPIHQHNSYPFTTTAQPNMSHQSDEKWDIQQQDFSTHLSTSKQVPPTVLNAAGLVTTASMQRQASGSSVHDTTLQQQPLLSASSMSQRQLSQSTQPPVLQPSTISNQRSVTMLDNNNDQILVADNANIGLGQMRSNTLIPSSLAYTVSTTGLALTSQSTYMTGMGPERYYELFGLIKGFKLKEMVAWLDQHKGQFDLNSPFPTALYQDQRILPHKMVDMISSSDPTALLDNTPILNTEVSFSTLTPMLAAVNLNPTTPHEEAIQRDICHVLALFGADLYFTHLPAQYSAHNNPSFADYSPLIASSFGKLYSPLIECILKHKFTLLYHFITQYGLILPPLPLSTLLTDHTESISQDLSTGSSTSYINHSLFHLLIEQYVRLAIDEAVDSVITAQCFAVIQIWLSLTTVPQTTTMKMFPSTFSIPTETQNPPNYIDMNPLGLDQERPEAFYSQSQMNNLFDEAFRFSPTLRQKVRTYLFGRVAQLKAREEGMGDGGSGDGDDDDNAMTDDQDESVLVQESPSTTTTTTTAKAKAKGRKGKAKGKRAGKDDDVTLVPQTPIRTRSQTQPMAYSPPVTRSAGQSFVDDKHEEETRTATVDYFDKLLSINMNDLGRRSCILFSLIFSHFFTYHSLRLSIR